MEYKILEKINEPNDLKSLSLENLNALSEEIRNALIKRISVTGGHFGPNLGMVEATIAMHYVFNSPIDKIVYDVAHQTYTHKILTGRKEAFLVKEKFKTVSGFTSQHESIHDFFIVGHTSTSISLACGLAKARDIKGDSENIIAVIGDGSLSGGQAYEGLNNASEAGTNMIIVVNDNEMSIAENYGGLYKNLKELRDSNGNATNNFFKTLGFDYLYVEEGNNIESLIKAFKGVKDTKKPIVVHIHTLKGKGFKKSEENKEGFHWVMPFDLEEKEAKENLQVVENYKTISSNFLFEKAKKDKSIVAITPGTPALSNLDSFRKNLKEQYIDVGIAEEHSIALASGMASRGAKPVVIVASSFIQRAYDQISQDLCINNNSALLMIYGGGMSSADVTHVGIYDISLISNIPNMVYLAPTTKNELLAMMDWGIEQNSHPVTIRVPNGNLIEGEKEEYDFSKLNVYKKIKSGKDVAIISVGSFYDLGLNVYEKLKEHNIEATLINPRFLSGIDVDMLNELMFNHKLVITLEDGLLDGGFGEKISRFYGEKDIKVLNYGAKKEFTDRVALEKVYEENRIDYKLIIEDIIRIL